MLQCRICGCYCDPSDTVNGVCDDCRADKEHKENAEQLVSAEFRQMELKEIEKK